MVCIVYLVHSVCFVYRRFQRELASGGSLPPPSVGPSFASAERASPRSKSWKMEAPPSSRSEKRHHPLTTCHTIWRGRLEVPCLVRGSGRGVQAT